MIAGGAVTELVVIGHAGGSVSWATPLVIVVCALAILALLVVAFPARVRAVVVAVALAALLAAPAAWAVDTLGHATSATFPAGGPTSASAGGFGGPGGFGGARLCGARTALAVALSRVRRGASFRCDGGVGLRFRCGRGVAPRRRGRGGRFRRGGFGWRGVRRGLRHAAGGVAVRGGSWRGHRGGREPEQCRGGDRRR